MIVTYLRSSSVGGYEWCAFRYLLENVMGFKSPANHKAELGNVVHKALELLARRKLAEQNNLDMFSDTEVGSFKTETMNAELALEVGYNHYSNPSLTKSVWAEGDKALCTKWLNNVLNDDGGMFNPLNRNVLLPEQYFDFTINKPWASYQYKLPNGKITAGQLALKGTVDLVTSVGDKVIEYCDWKTGERKNWKTNKLKEHADLMEDFQMRLYHYALKKLYPDCQIIITIYFIRSGGPFTLYFQDSDIEKTENIIREKFEKIKNDKFPKRIYKRGEWKCERVPCHFYKEKWKGTNKNVCDFMWEEMIQIGMDKLVKKYGDTTKISEYGDGGGTSKK